MLKYDEIKKEYHLYSGKVSDRVRQLTFAGIAIVWLFKIEQKGSGMPRLPLAMMPPTAALLAALLLDFLQYSWGTAAYQIRVIQAAKKRKKDELGPDAEYRISEKYVVLPMELFFWAKVVAVVIAYAYLLCFVVATHLFSA